MTLQYIQPVLLAAWRVLGLAVCALLTITAFWIGVTEDASGFIGVILFPAAAYWWWQD